MTMSRQQILLAALGVIAILHFGDWILNSVIQGPLEQRRARTDQLQKDIAKKEKLIAETRNAAKQIASWQKQSLPSDPEIARTVYRSWLLQQVKAAKLRNAVVDSGSPASRRTKTGELLLRTMPFSVRCRGSLAEFNTFLFQFTRAGHLHQIASMTITPISQSGQFDISLGIETLLLSSRKGDQLNKDASTLMSSNELVDYSSIVKNNFFGVGRDGVDPMKHTMVSAITFSDGTPLVWITEETTGKTIRVGLNEHFSTVALDGTVISASDRTAIIESGNEQIPCSIGVPFSEAIKSNLSAAAVGSP